MSISETRVARECDIPSVGLPYFDEQHQRLIGILHELDSSVSRNMKVRLVREALLKLMNFAEVHFYAEESMMESISFPGLEDHRREHGKIRMRLNEFKTEVDRGVTASAEELLTFVYQWIDQHLATFDVDYGKFYLARGLEFASVRAGALQPTAAPDRITVN
jgi:hemerythrin-like metal-binding protein